MAKVPRMASPKIVSSLKVATARACKFWARAMKGMKVKEQDLQVEVVGSEKQARALIATKARRCYTRP